jgi:hypothetical protein
LIALGEINNARHPRRRVRSGKRNRSQRFAKRTKPRACNPPGFAENAYG